MNRFKIVYYETENHICPVQEFINGRDMRNQAKIFAYLDLLEEKGPVLPRPYADILEDGIHELRIKLSGDQIRILYFFTFKEFIILTHALIKNTEKVSKSEIEKAKKFRNNFLKRFSEKKLREEFENEDIK